LQARLSDFVRELRRTMRAHDPDTESANTIARAVIDFVGVQLLRQAFPEYRRQQDFDRASALAANGACPASDIEGTRRAIAEISRNVYSSELSNVPAVWPLPANVAG